MDPAQRLATEIADLQRRLRAIERGSQLSRSSVQVDGRPVTVAEGVRTGVAAAATADSKNRVTWADAPPPAVDDLAGDERPGDVWYQKDDTGAVVGQWEFVSVSAGYTRRDLTDAVVTSLTAAKITSGEIAAGQEIIAGDPDGDHVSISGGQGILVYAADPDGAAREVTRLGTGGADRFLITDGAGSSLASVDSTGGASFKSLAVDADPVFRGRSLSELLDERPRGIIARAGVATSTPATDSAVGVYDVEFTAVPGRTYRISTSSLSPSPSTTATYIYAALTARASTLGPPNLAAGKPLVAQRGTAGVAGGASPMVLTRDVGFSELWEDTPPTVPTKIRVLLVYGVVSGGGTCTLFGAPSYPIHTYVQDIGPELPFTGVANLGGGSTGTPTSNYQQDFAATWARSWKHNSSAYRTDTNGEMVQGYTPYAPQNGIGIGQFGFQDLTGILAGSTINWAAVFIWASHWHNDVGGVGLLGHHPYLNAPDTKPADWSLNSMGTVNQWPKPGGVWVYLSPAQLNNLASGATRGFTLGDGASTASPYYGRFAGVGNSRPVLRVNWTK